MSEPDIHRVGIGGNHELAFYPSKGSARETTIVMLHGMWATRSRFDRWARYFSDRGFPCAVPTYRHHHAGNKNNAELGRTSVVDYASDVLTGIVGGLPRRLIVMGHSMGGPIAQLLTTWVPKSIVALIMLCSAPVAGISLHTDKDYKKRIMRLAPKIFGSKPYLPDFETMSQYVYNGMPKGEHEALYKGAVYESGTAAREILAGSGEGLPRHLARLYTEPIEINEANVACPTLVVGGSIDRVTPPEIARDLQKKYAGFAKPCDLHIFPNVAHWVQYEPGWELRAELVLQWIKANVPIQKK